MNRPGSVDRGVLNGIHQKLLIFLCLGQQFCRARFSMFRVTQLQRTVDADIKKVNFCLEISYAFYCIFV